MDAGARDLPLTALRALVVALGTILAGFVLYAFVARLRHPIDLEWMTGSVLDHVDRVRRGLPIYTEPSPDWTPFLYPPLYYYASAALSRVLDLVVACRVVSIASTFASAAIAFRLSRALGATRYWSAVAVLLFAAAYSYTGYWYDIERCDSLCVALLLGGTLVAARARGWRGALGAGAILGAAYLAKQPALFFVVAGAAAFALAGDARKCVALVAGALAIIAPSFAWLDASTNGWYRFYVVTAPAKHGLLWKEVTLFLFSDAMTAFALAGATFAAWAMVVPEALRRVRARARGDAPPLLFASMLAAAFVASWASRLHLGGFPNVLMFWSSFGCVGVAVVASRVEKESRVASALACGVVLMQLVRFAFDPSEPVPDDRRVREAASFAARVRAIEARGEVWVWGRGHLTAHMHAHAAAIQDVLRTGAPIPDGVRRAFDEQRFAAFVIEGPDELSLEKVLGHRSDLLAVVAASYFVAVRYDDREAEPVVGWQHHPAWELRPRAKRLDIGPDALARRQRIEIGIAEMRMRAVQAGARQRDDGLDVEQLAAEIDRP